MTAIEARARTDRSSGSDRSPQACRVWLVRLAESAGRVGGGSGRSEGPARLTRRGRRQARQLRTCLAGVPIQAVWSSDESRSLQTAELLAGSLGVPMQQDERLRPRSFGHQDGSPAARPPELTGILGGRVFDPDAAPPGGESVRAMAGRAASFVRDTLSEAPRGDLVVIAHGSTLAVLRACLARSDLEGMQWIDVPHGGIVCLPVDRAAKRVALGSPRARVGN